MRSLFFRKKEVRLECSRERRLSRAQQDESGTATAKRGVGSAVVAPITCRLDGAGVSAETRNRKQSQLEICLNQVQGRGVLGWNFRDLRDLRDAINYFGG